MTMRRSIAVCVLVLMCLLTGCGNITYYNLEADDAISSAIYEELGEGIYYLGKEDFSNNDLCYEYLLCEEKADLLYNMIVEVNETIKQEGISEKIEIFCGAEIPGGVEWVVIFSNYSNDTIDSPDYEGMCKLTIMGDDIGMRGDNYLYNNPMTYVNLPDIKYLQVSEKIQERAEAEGIDWYEYWPELESVEVYTVGQ